MHGFKIKGPRSASFRQLLLYHAPYLKLDLATGVFSYLLLGIYVCVVLLSLLLF